MGELTDQSDQPIGRFVIFCVAFALVAIARFADAKRNAGDPYAIAPILDSFFDYLPSAR
jgi:hypothetical protein